MKITDQLSSFAWRTIPFDRPDDFIIQHVKKKTVNRSGHHVIFNQAWYNFCCTYKKYRAIVNFLFP